jgi:hypothetical protein
VSNDPIDWDEFDGPGRPMLLARHVRCRKVVAIYWEMERRFPTTEQVDCVGGWHLAADVNVQRRRCACTPPPRLPDGAALEAYLDEARSKPEPGAGSARKTIPVN